MGAWGAVGFRSGAWGVVELGEQRERGLVIDTPLQMATACITRFRDRVLMASPLSFDPSIIEIFGALLEGGTLICAEDAPCSGRAFLTAIKAQRVSALQCTPSFLRQLSVVEPHFLRPLVAHKTLRLLASGGEMFPSPAELRTWLGMTAQSNAPRLRVFNLYGVTELSVWQTIKEVDLCEWLQVRSGCWCCARAVNDDTVTFTTPTAAVSDCDAQVVG